MGDFFKLDNGEVLQAGGSIYAPSGIYVAADHEQYTYPTPEGWYWYDDPAVAMITLSNTSPDRVTALQGRVALMNMPSPTESGKTLLESVNDYCAAQGGIIQIAWEYTGDFTRKGALVSQVLKAQFALTDAQIDNLFKAAAVVSL